MNCQYVAKDKQIELICENINCKRKFRRQPSDISPNNYCSRSCAAIVNNAKDPKRQKRRKICDFCRVIFTSQRKKYCSDRCQYTVYVVPSEKIITQIRSFYQLEGRIPLKREFKHYSAARKRFGTWNKAIEAAGFKPNPVLFADRCIANDGHICDSVAEKLIDDYLYKKGIAHHRNIPYPEGTYTADFKIGTKLIEYFGLAGEHKRYDELRRIKQKIAKSYRLNLIEIYPKDLYPSSKLDIILNLQ